MRKTRGRGAARGYARIPWGVRGCSKGAAPPRPLPRPAHSSAEGAGDLLSVALRASLAQRQQVGLRDVIYAEPLDPQFGGVSGGEHQRHAIPLSASRELH